MTKIAVKDLRQNPFRDLTRLPTKPAKIEVLKQSIKATGFWDNIIARKLNGGDYEIAYGHNRLEALRQLKQEEVDIPVRVLPDDIMIKVMATENLEEWGATSDVEQEAVRAVVIAFAEGKIQLPKANVTEGKAGAFRVAPSFLRHSDTTIISDAPEMIYSASTISKFLGWNPWKVDAALSALGAVEQRLLKADDFKGLTPVQAETVVRQTRRVAKESGDKKLATRIGRKLADGMRPEQGRRAGVGGKAKGSLADVTVKTAKYIADALMRDERVNLRIEQRQAKRDKLNLQKEDRQVKIFLDACKVFEAALVAAGKATSKFSPEARAFTARRLDRISDEVLHLSGRMK